MRKQILSVCLSLAILAASGATYGMQASATETAAEGASVIEAVPAETEFAAPQEEEESVPTDAAGNVIAPEVAQAIDSADVGVTDLEKMTDAAQAADDVAGVAEEAIQAPVNPDDADMNKSTINAAFDSTYAFTKEDVVVYVSQAVSVKAEPADEAEDIASIDKYATVHLTGSNDLKYWEVTVGGEIGYIDSAVIVRERAEIEALKADDIRKEETEAQSRQEQEEAIVEKTTEAGEEWAQALKDSRREELAQQTRNLNWNGPVLSRSKGSVYGPSGKETYYNLNMSGCVRNMNRRGYYYDVWVRNDGCKMFGDYIMCAANLGVHPFGSLVECSLGTCIVVDTGGFAAGNPNQLDIAVTW
ncbi:MAG: hypothetical protein IJ100_01575 [Lachnospiraceae bacterium]|nr:hypothetical protein [Lachnospiraceae bacterium]